MCSYEAVGLLILPVKRMLPVEFSKMKTKKGLSILTGVGVVSGIHSEMVMAAASVPISVTLIVALWDAFDILSGNLLDTAEKSAMFSKALVMPISCNIFLKEALVAMENFGI